MKKKHITLTVLGLMVVSNLPLFAQEKKSKAKKAFSCTYQLVKIGVGCGLLAAAGRDFFYNPKFWKIPGHFAEFPFNNSLSSTVISELDTKYNVPRRPLCEGIGDPKENLTARFIQESMWTTTTVSDLYKNVAALTVMQLATAGTGLGLIISGIKKIYHEYAAHQSGIEKEGHSPIVVGASEKE